MANIIIFGAGDFAGLVYKYFQMDTKHKVVAFTVDAEYLKQDSFCDLPLVPFEKITELYPPSEYKMFVALGYTNMNKLRAEKCFQSKKKGYELISYINSKSTILTEYPIGENCFIFENVNVQPSVKIGNNVIIWNGCNISHGDVIEDHSYLAPCVALGGYVRIKSFCFVGINSTIHHSVTIESESLIGAGSVILEDTVEGGVYYPPRTVLSRRKSDEVTI